MKKEPENLKPDFQTDIRIGFEFSGFSWIPATAFAGVQSAGNSLLNFQKNSRFKSDWYIRLLF
ncbi:MAG: hypothetical protein OXJ52_05115 [Oligoflexia bacterium]|nr:hypothetical protein [Oligoflexia bacterium]